MHNRLSSLPQQACPAGSSQPAHPGRTSAALIGHPPLLLQVHLLLGLLVVFLYLRLLAFHSNFVLPFMEGYHRVRKPQGSSTQQEGSAAIQGQGGAQPAAAAGASREAGKRAKKSK
jgi:hypothetical protein